MIIPFDEKLSHRANLLGFGARKWAHRPRSQERMEEEQIAIILLLQQSVFKLGAEAFFLCQSWPVFREPVFLTMLYSHEIVFSSNFFILEDVFQYYAVEILPKSSLPLRTPQSVPRLLQRRFTSPYPLWLLVLLRCLVGDRSFICGPEWKRTHLRIVNRLDPAQLLYVWPCASSYKHVLSLHVVRLRKTTGNYCCYPERVR